MNHIIISKENIRFFSELVPEDFYTDGDRITIGTYDDYGNSHGVISYLSLGFECVLDWIFVKPTSRRTGIGTGLVKEMLSAIVHTGICPLSARFEADRNNGLFEFFISQDEFETDYLFDRFYVKPNDLLNSPSLAKEIQSNLTRYQFFEQSAKVQNTILMKLRELENGFEIEDPLTWEDSCVPEFCLFSGAEDDPEVVIFVQKRDDGNLELSYLFSTNPKEMISVMTYLRRRILRVYPKSDLVFDAVNATSDGIARKLFPLTEPVNIYEASFPA